MSRAKGYVRIYPAGRRRSAPFGSFSVEKMGCVTPEPGNKVVTDMLPKIDYERADGYTPPKKLAPMQGSPALSTCGGADKLGVVHVLAVRDCDMSWAEVVTIFRVSLASLKRWRAAQLTNTGTITRTTSYEFHRYCY